MDRALIRLVLYFLKLGATGFGGTAALIGYMERDLVEKKGWFTRKEYLHALALAQLVPGPIAQQMAIYFGWLKGRILGATAVGIAFVLPSFLIVWALSYLYVRYHGLTWMDSFFYGMAAAVIAVMVQACLRLVKISLEKKKGLWLIFLVMALTTATQEKASFFYFLASGVAAVFIYAFPRGRLFLVPSAELCFFFMKAAVTVYGSGMAIIPFIYRDVVQSYAWLNDKQFLDAMVVGMITPGPVLITVGFIGYLVDDFLGAAASVAGVFLPVYLFVIILAPWFHKILRNTQVQAFVEGVTAAATGSIAGAVFILGQRAIVDWPTAIITLATLGILFKTRFPTPLLLLGCGLAGIGIKTLM